MNSDNKTKKLKNRGKNLCESMILELWTPVHIGSGEELKNKADFILENSAPFVVDIKQTLDSIRTKDPQLKKYCSSEDIEDLMEISGQKYGYSLPRLSKAANPESDNRPTISASFIRKQRMGAGAISLPVKKPYSDKKTVRSEFSEIETIREQLKDAFLRPYIPGSSIKGAVRTALWAEALHQDENYRKELQKETKREANERENNRPNNNLEGYVFSSYPQADPKADIMRSLHISDGYFEQKTLHLGDVRWANVCGDGKDAIIKWRDLRQKNSEKNKSNWKEAKGVYIEALGRGAKTEVIFSYDEFLLSDFSDWSPANPQTDNFSSVGSLENSSRSESKNQNGSIKSQDGVQSKKRKEFSHIPPRNFQELRAILNRHALRIIKNEKGFFKKYKLPEVCEFYSELEKEIEKTKNEFAWLRLGYGCGWTSMTGLTESFLDTDKQLRKNIYGMNRTGKKKIHPKTRRLLALNGSPRLPFGWVRVRPSDGIVLNPYRKSSVTLDVENCVKTSKDQAIQSAGGSFKTNNASSSLQDSVSLSPGLSKTVSDLMDKHKIKSQDEALKSKILAQEWQNLPNGEEKQKVKKEIINYWEKQSWWDERYPSKGQKKAKEIYQRS